MPQWPTQSTLVSPWAAITHRRGRIDRGASSTWFVGALREAPLRLPAFAGENLPIGDGPNLSSASIDRLNTIHTRQMKRREPGQEGEKSGLRLRKSADQTSA